ncbi:hypothetical protein QW180_05940 [Vibrio sinaloensis]|nr:hypothetical protein [Vibrio sinaloensis]
MPEQDLLSCNIEQALQNVVYGKEQVAPSIRHEFVRVNKEGARPFPDKTRYIPSQMTGDENSPIFLFSWSCWCHYSQVKLPNRK